MPATVTHIIQNFELLDKNEDGEYPAGLIELAKFAQQSALVNGVIDWQVAWKEFVASADKAKVANLIPGSVGKKFALAYGMAETKPKAKRGARVEIRLSEASVTAIGRFGRESDQFKITHNDAGDSFFSFTNRQAAIKAIKAMIRRSSADIDLPPRDNANKRNALRALLKKVDI